MGIKFLSSAVMTVLATPLVEAAGTAVLTACRASVGLMEVEATFGSLSRVCQLLVVDFWPMFPPRMRSRSVALK